MNKTEIIARRILGWKLARWDKWYDYRSNTYIENFAPEKNLEHAMMIVERLNEYGFKYEQKGDKKVCFNDYCAEGRNLAEAITNAAFEIADNSTIDDEWL